MKKVYIVSKGYFFEDAREVRGVYTGLERAKSEGVEVAREMFCWGDLPEWGWALADNVYKFEFSGCDDWPTYVRIESHEVIE